jgi:hypothetical protein
MMPTLLDEACREYYGLTEAALDAREAARPASPRTLAALDALERYDALKESAHGREYVREQEREQEREGLTREQVAQTAYEMAEQDIALNASWKVFKGEELSSYEQSVRNDFFVAQGFSFVVGRVGGPLAASAVSKPVAKLVAKGLKSAKPAVKIKAAEMEDAVGIKVSESGRMYGTHKALTKAGAQDSHHVIQHAAVKDIPGYNRDLAPAVQLRGPATGRGTEHNLATIEQRRAGGGTYELERIRAYRAMRKADVSVVEAKQQIQRADRYFQSLGVDKTTITRIPGNRKGTIE